MKDTKSKPETQVERNGELTEQELEQIIAGGFFGRKKRCGGGANTTY